MLAPRYKYIEDSLAAAVEAAAIACESITQELLPFGVW
jgi:hypothetical protein